MYKNLIDQVDRSIESVSLDLLQRAMKIYARALLALNEMEW